VARRFLVAILLLVLVIVAGAVAGCAGGLPSDAVAKVGDVPILKADFDKRVQEFATQYSVTPKEQDPEGWADFESKVLDYLVMYELASQKATDLGVTVTDADVQTEIDNIVTTYYGGDQAAFDTDLQNNNMTVEQLKASYKESMLMQKVYEKVTENVTTVPDADIQAYYDANKDQYLQDETRVARHILITPGGPATNPATTTTTTPWGSSTTTEGATTTTEATTTTTTGTPTDADWAAALETANQVRALLVAGGDWTKLAAEYSDDPGSKDAGGELGEVSKGQMVQEFEDSVFSLKANEISQPVKTTYGYHIIEVTAINAAKQYTLDEVKDDITSNLLNELKGKAWDKWIADTKKEIGVVYAKGMEPTTTTTAAPQGGTPDTTAAGDTTTTVGASDTTATTAAGETIGTDTTATTAKP
jgi:foldase protein PrsA